LSIPILINSKDNIEAGIPNQTLDGKGAVFLLDSGIVGETSMVTIFMENLKERLPYHAKKNQFVYRCLCGKL
jgi:mevalonate kinase